MRAKAELAAKDFDGADRDLQRTINLAPQQSTGYVALANLRTVQKRFDDARVLFEQALTKNPADLEGLAGLVQLNLMQKDPTAAVARINQQITKVPANPGLYLLRGQVQMATKDYRSAEESFNESLRLEPNSTDALLALSKAQLASGSAQQARDSYEKAIQQKPRDARAYLLLGFLDEAEGNWQDAERQYQKLLSIEPDNAIAANNLAYDLLEHSGNIDRAATLAEKAHRLMPRASTMADTLGWAYVKKGTPGRAINLLGPLVGASPDNPIYRYHLGVAYEKNSEADKAREQFERALQLNPPQTERTKIQEALEVLAKDPVQSR